MLFKNKNTPQPPQEPTSGTTPSGEQLPAQFNVDFGFAQFFAPADAPPQQAQPTEAVAAPPAPIQQLVVQPPVAAPIAPPVSEPVYVQEPVASPTEEADSGFSFAPVPEIQDLPPAAPIHYPGPPQAAPVYHQPEIPPAAYEAPFVNHDSSPDPFYDEPEVTFDMPINSQYGAEPQQQYPEPQYYDSFQVQEEVQQYPQQMPPQENHYQQPQGMQMQPEFFNTQQMQPQQPKSPYPPTQGYAGNTPPSSGWTPPPEPAMGPVSGYDGPYTPTQLNMGSVVDDFWAHSSPGFDDHTPYAGGQTKPIMPEDITGEFLDTVTQKLYPQDLPMSPQSMPYDPYAGGMPQANLQAPQQQPLPGAQPVQGQSYNQAAFPPAQNFPSNPTLPVLGPDTNIDEVFSQIEATAKFESNDVISNPVPAEQEWDLPLSFEMPDIEATIKNTGQNIDNQPTPEAALYPQPAQQPQPTIPQYQDLPPAQINIQQDLSAHHEDLSTHDLPSMADFESQAHDIEFFAPDFDGNQPAPDPIEDFSYQAPNSAAYSPVLDMDQASQLILSQNVERWDTLITDPITPIEAPAPNTRFEESMPTVMIAASAAPDLNSASATSLPGVDVEDIQVIDVFPLENEKSLLFVEVKGNFALMGLVGGSFSTIKLFEADPRAEGTTQFTATKEQGVGGKDIFHVHAGRWQGVVSVDESSISLLTEFRI